MTRHTYTIVIDDPNDDSANSNNAYLEQLINDDGEVEVHSITHVSTEELPQEDDTVGDEVI